MNNREKKPPVNINELKKVQEEEEHEKGPLNYMGEKNDPRGGPATKSKINLTQLILAIGISVLVFFLIAQFTLTSKSDSMVLLDNQRLLESSQAATGAQLNTETGRIENVIAAQANFAQKSELAGFDNAITSIGNRVDEIEPIVDRIEPIVDDHEDRIIVLEESVNGTVLIGGGGALDYYIEYKSGEPYLHATSIRGGVFDIRLTLVPGSPYGLLGDTLNGAYKDFYTSFGTRYIPVIIWEDSVWKVSEVSINYGTRHLEKGIEKKGYLDDLPSLPGGFGTYDIFVELLTGTSEPDSVEDGGF